ncbi:MAG: AMP-binding protein, partial [Woeseiaceae bacterium]
MTTPSTVFDLLQPGDDNSTSISGIDRPDLNYRDLRELVTRTADSLNRLGIGRNDRVAIVLPNGPEMAAAFVAVSACATTAPLNPAYKKDEYDFYLSDLNARALLVEKDSQSPAVTAAREHGIQILELETQSNRPAGAFTIRADESGQFSQSDHTGMAGPDDVALVLHTSGTTSRPKIVPLRHSNVCA